MLANADSWLAARPRPTSSPGLFVLAEDRSVLADDAPRVLMPHTDDASRIATSPMSDRTVRSDDDPRTTMDRAVQLGSALRRPVAHADTSTVDCCFAADSSTILMPPSDFRFPSRETLVTDHATFTTPHRNALVAPDRACLTGDTPRAPMAHADPRVVDCWYKSSAADSDRTAIPSPHLAQSLVDVPHRNIFPETALALPTPHADEDSHITMLHTGDNSCAPTLPISAQDI